VPSNPNK